MSSPKDRQQELPQRLVIALAVITFASTATFIYGEKPSTSDLIWALHYGSLLALPVLLAYQHSALRPHITETLFPTTTDRLHRALIIILMLLGISMWLLIREGLSSRYSGETLAPVIIPAFGFFILPLTITIGTLLRNTNIQFARYVGIGLQLLTWLAMDYMAIGTLQVIGILN